MTKRNSSIFTVAESVINWFEASDHNAIEVGEEMARSLDSSRAPAAHATVNQQSADSPEITNAPENRSEVGQRVVDWAEATTDPTAQYEVGDGTATWTIANNWTTTGTKGVGNCGEVNQAEGGTGDVADLGHLEVVANLIPPPNADMAEVDTRVPAAFWRLLKDAGYEDW